MLVFENYEEFQRATTKVARGCLETTVIKLKTIIYESKISYDLILVLFKIIENTADRFCIHTYINHTGLQYVCTLIIQVMRKGISIQLIK
ncbi:MAG: hypothetical protein ACI9EW_000852 [Cellvibrionaceae bacterium]|jgi:hypothetical protein